MLTLFRCQESVNHCATQLIQPQQPAMLTTSSDVCELKLSMMTGTVTYALSRRLHQNSVISLKCLTTMLQCKCYELGKRLMN